MRIPGIALLLFGLLMPAVSAAEATAVQTGQSLSTIDLVLIFIGGVIYINIFVVVLYHVVKRQKARTGRSPLVRIAGILMGMVAVAIGSMILIFLGMVLLNLFAGLNIFSWTDDLFLYLITRVVHLSLSTPDLTMTAGILLFGAVGTAFFLVGAILLVHFGGYASYAQVAMPTGSGAVKKDAADRPDEPLNPVLSFRVKEKRTDEPAADVKVILKHKDGVRFHTKYTDFSGKVTFTNVEGFGSEYYAYVDGDIDREYYRVIRI